MLIDALPMAFTVRTATAMGLERSELDGLVRDGILAQPFRAVYVPADMVSDTVTRAQALSLLLPSGTVLAEETAAWVYGVDVRPPSRFRKPPRMCVVTANDQAVNPVRRTGIQARLAELPMSDVAMVGEVLLTSPERTALDLARYYERYIGLAALDAFSHAGLVRLGDMVLRVRSMSGYRWIARARSVLELADPRTESPGESWVRLRIHEAGLPMPEPQVRLRDDIGREIYRLDLGYREARVGIEYDGVAHHHATDLQSDRDQRRITDIEERWGWQVLTFHAGDVLGKRPVLERAIAEVLDLPVQPFRRPWSL